MPLTFRRPFREATKVLGSVLGYQVYRLEELRRADRSRHESELLEERRCGALDKALLALRQDDLEGAQGAIREAEQLGCAPSQLHMFRAQVALFQGQTTEAIEHLTDAVRLTPQSAAAWSMLAVAQNRAGDVTGFNRSLAEALRLPAETADDYLFRGLAESQLDPERGLTTLDEAVRRRPSTVARLVRVEALKMSLMDTPRPDKAEQAMDDVRLIKHELPDDPMALGVSLDVHLACLRVFEEFALPARKQAALEEAWKECRALERFPKLPNAIMRRWIFLWEIGSPQSARDDLVRLAETSEYAIYYHALGLYRDRDFEAAVEILARKKEIAALNLMRGFMLAELPDGHKQANNLYAEIATQDLSSWGLFNSQLLLRFLGRKEAAIEVSQKFLRQPDRFPPVRRDSFQRALEYCAGRRSADELLDSLRGSRADLVNAHLCVALTALAEGNREEARKHFRLCMQTRFIEFLPYDVGTMLLGRMEHDPTWPPWIPVKKDQR